LKGMAGAAAVGLGAKFGLDRLEPEDEKGGRPGTGENRRENGAENERRKSEGSGQEAPKSDAPESRTRAEKDTDGQAPDTEAQGQTEKAAPRFETREQKKAREICDQVLDGYHQLTASKVWPERVFTHDLFMSQQLAESGYDSQAESHVGAVGVMQTTPIAKKDVVRYLGRLSDSGVIDFKGSRDIFEKTDKHNGNKVMGEVMELVKQNPDYSRAFGKIYMTLLQDPEYGYGVGEKYFRKGNSERGLKEVLGAYNAGRRKIVGKPFAEWNRESKQYCKNIFHYKHIIKRTRQQLEIHNLPADNNELVLLITQQALNAKHKKGQYWIISDLAEKLAEKKQRSGQVPDANAVRQLVASK